MKVFLLSSHKLRPCQRLVYSFLAAKVYFADEAGSEPAPKSERWIAHRSKLDRATVHKAVTALQEQSLVEKRGIGWVAKAPAEGIFHQRKPRPGATNHWYNLIQRDPIVYRDNFRRALVERYCGRGKGVRETARLTGLSLTTVKRYFKPPEPTETDQQPDPDRWQKIMHKRIRQLATDDEIKLKDKYVNLFLEAVAKELERLRELGCTLEVAQKGLSVVVHYPYSPATILVLLLRGHLSGIWSVVRNDAKPQASLFRNCGKYLDLLTTNGHNYDPFAIKIAGTTVTTDGFPRRLIIPKKKQIA